MTFLQRKVLVPEMCCAYNLDSINQDSECFIQLLSVAVPECDGLQRLRGQPLEHPLQRRVQRVVFIAERLAAALQQPLVEAGLTQHLLVPLAVHQELQDVGNGELEVQGMLEEKVGVKRRELKETPSPPDAYGQFSHLGLALGGDGGQQVQHGQNGPRVDDHHVGRG